MNILIIDNDPETLSFLRKKFRRERFSVDTAKTAQQGLRRVLSNFYNIVLLEVQLPDKNGIELCENIRAQGIDVPILIISARDATADKIEGLANGADDYLAKPFNFEELLARMYSLSRRQRVYEDAVLKTGDLILNTTSREVERGKRSIHLSGKQFALLHYLLKNKGKIISREQLISHLWGSKPVASNRLEVTLGRLRKSIGCRSEKLIETIHGVGYRVKSI